MSMPTPMQMRGSCADSRSVLEKLSLGRAFCFDPEATRGDGGRQARPQPPSGRGSPGAFKSAHAHGQGFSGVRYLAKRSKSRLRQSGEWRVKRSGDGETAAAFQLCCFLSNSNFARVLHGGVLRHPPMGDL